MIDAPDCADKIIAFADGKGLKITDIILTHGHFDHMLALAELKAATGARLSVFEKTERFLEDRVLNLCHYMGIELSPIKADNILYDGDMINFGENRIKVIATPGHTKGSCCYYFEEDQVLISGDTLFQESVGRTDFPTGSMSALVRSVKEKLFSLPDETRVYPGHGMMTTIGYEKENNAFV